MSLVKIMEKAGSGGYGEDSELIGKIAGMIQVAQFDKSWGPFICGTIGKLGPEGLHDGYLICPAYGADASATVHFKRV